MEFNNGIAISSMHNIVVALNEGGMLTCAGLRDRLWGMASESSRERKVSAARRTTNRNEAYAKAQLSQEIRRSINQYFNGVSSNEEFIYSATPLDSPEYFWVEEPQEYDPENTPDPEFEGLPIPASLMESLIAIKRGLISEFEGLPDTPANRQGFKDRVESALTELGVLNV